MAIQLSEQLARGCTGIWVSAARREVPNKLDDVEVHMDSERKSKSLAPSIEIPVPFGMRRSQGEVTATLI